MPKITRMDEEEIKKITEKRVKKTNSRLIIRQQYVDMLKGYHPGEWVSVELEENEDRLTVKNRLGKAAQELGWKLEFKRTRNPRTMIFEIKTVE
jgi:hypothetical protein